ncbi:LysR family transcriptional regulator, partial [Bacillus xiapuensis]|nr:LysR family transcriptional regulator [Bacillus xiapuensis]
MEINDLIIFKTVVTKGSISKAAKELGYVQPHISERIKKLEQELEILLLHRNNKGISLLPPGEILLDYTDKILNLLEEAKNQIKVGRDSYSIATTQSILSHYLRDRIKENFMHYQIYMEHSHRLKQFFKSQNVDMVITYDHYSDPVFHKVFCTTISMGLHTAKGKSKIEYSKEVFFVSHDNQCPFRNHTIAFLKEHNLSKNQLQQVDSYSLIEEFVSQGIGVAFLPINKEKLDIVGEV